jgi:hypothetical protein
MNKIYSLFATVSIMVFVCACSTEHDLEKTVFIEDKNAPGLPIYSEWGYNSFGAYFDRMPFKSSEAFTPAKIEITEGIARFILEGDKGPKYSLGDRLRLTMTLPGFTPGNYQELIELHDTEINLASSDGLVEVSLNGETLASDLLSGKITFIRAQRLLVDKVVTEVILSGRFELKVVLDGSTVTIDEGRFDVAINDDNFFLIPE